jgi:hypothetical protein
MTRKRFEASDSVDASHRLVYTHRSTSYRAECHCAVGPLQLAKCFRAVFKLDHCLLGWRSICSDFCLSDAVPRQNSSASNFNELATQR